MALPRVQKYLERLVLSQRCICIHIQKNSASTSRPLYRTNEPVKYSATKASKITVRDTFYRKDNPAVLSIERYVVILTLIGLMIYFGFLREENKLDQILSGKFDYETDDEIKLVNALLHAKLKGLKTDDIEKKLNQIRGNK